MWSLTCCAVSITCYEEVSTIVLSVLSNTLNIYEILLRSDVVLVEVEEYVNWSTNEFLNSLCLSLWSWLLLSKELLQTSVLCISIVELCVESVEL